MSDLSPVLLLHLNPRPEQAGRRGYLSVNACENNHERSSGSSQKMILQIGGKAELVIIP